MASPSDSIRTYIRAKDENRPHLLRRAFSPSATVAVVVNTPHIAFPPLVTGIESIADSLIRGFGRIYENVYTFCLSPPPKNESRRFSCNWLVGMSEKENGAVRVGRGRYDWSFAGDGRGLVERLKITIESMQSFAPDRLGPIMDWLSGIPYPWCSIEAAAKNAPEIDGLAEIIRRLDVDPA